MLFLKNSQRIKYLLASILLIGFSFYAAAQTSPATQKLKIEDCYKLAENNYPLVKQRELISKSRDYSIENISKGMLPQLFINGQATYQSDVTQIKIPIPGINIESIPKDQYKLFGEITQPITDLTTIKDQKNLQETNSSLQEQNLEVELYKLKDRVNQLFFGALLINEQNAQNELLKKDIKNGITRMTAAINNGVDFKASLDKMKAELLRADQRSTELKASRKAFMDMLGLFINQTLDENTELEKPASPAINNSINRPELSIFDLQKKSYGIQRKLITAKNLPRVSLFFQGGFGQPSPVNMLSKDLSTYYITGARLNWNITGFYTYRREKQLNDISVQLVETQKEAFLFNTNLMLKQQNTDIEKLLELLKTDDEIVELRTSVKNTSSIQLENGVITANDYLREINAEDQARQNRLLHETQLLMAQYNYLATSGNLQDKK